ncbi:MAG: dihydrofolate reductase [Candidatus Roizmanbacteria bacterium]|nr:dihydrofolate reductase [Candidatus Roizmanbacteria bacterium]
MINIIAAIGKNRELGKDNKLLWHITEDFKRFKILTSGHIVIMGRKTFESIGKPLPNRVNIVITRNRAWTPLGCTVCYSMEEAIKKAKRNLPAGRQVFIIGGAEIYKQGIKYADKLYLTLVNKEYPDADAFFPDYSAFKKVVFEENHKNKNYSFKFLELQK